MTKAQQFWRSKTVRGEALPRSEEPVALPPGLSWVELTTIPTLQVFLAQNFGSTEQSFGIVYSAEYLTWALNDQRPFTALGLQHHQTLVGFCKGWRVWLSVDATEPPQPFLVTSFLCLHTSYRGQAWVERLLNEMLRRMAALDLRYGLAISAKALQRRPLVETRYYNRFLNPVKLLNVGFFHYPRLTPQRAQKLYPIPARSDQFQPLQPFQLDALTVFLNQQLKAFRLRQHFEDRAATQRLFLPTPGVNQTAVECDAQGALLRLYSYHIVTLQKGATVVRAAYVLYVLGENDLLEAWRQLLADAHAQGCDLVVATDHMRFAEVREALAFKESPAVRKYFLFNHPPLSLQRSDVAFTWI